MAAEQRVSWLPNRPTLSRRSIRECSLKEPFPRKQLIVAAVAHVNLKCIRGIPLPASSKTRCGRRSRKPLGSLPKCVPAAPTHIRLWRWDTISTRFECAGES
jgi:hypothetical protein